MFRPCRFSRLRRFTPLSVARACCIPLPDMGFAQFSADCQPRLTSNGPHERSTLQSFPSLISRLRRRRRPFLLAVTSPPESGLPRPQGFILMKNPLRPFAWSLVALLGFASTARLSPSMNKQNACSLTSRERCDPAPKRRGCTGLPAIALRQLW
jgi:hypothetical protein